MDLGATWEGQWITFGVFINGLTRYYALVHRGGRVVTSLYWDSDEWFVTVYDEPTRPPLLLRDYTLHDLFAQAAQRWGERAAYFFPPWRDELTRVVERRGR